VVVVNLVQPQTRFATPRNRDNSARFGPFNIAGARRIILLGFDMQWTGGKSHFFGDHAEGLRNKDPTAHIPHFTQLAADLEREGVEVINCTRETALYQFKRATLEQVI